MAAILLIEYKHPKRKNVHRCGPVWLKTGINEIRKADWESVYYIKNGNSTQEHPMLKKMIDDEYIKILGQKGAKGKKKDDEVEEISKPALESYSVVECKKLIENVNDLELLLKWREEENVGKERKGVVNAIEAKMKDIHETEIDDAEDND